VQNKFQSRLTGEEDQAQNSNSNRNPSTGFPANFPNATVFEAIQLMADKSVGALPVVDNSRLVGIISERDYARKVTLKGRSSKDTPVRDIMTKELLTATPSDSIAECIRVMTEKRVRHLPVLEGNEMIGIVSIGDVLKWFFRPRQSTTSNDM
jgi:signal-transduction protein with cAMP-binding, CBS, and nucleotidyltransferase domain